MGGKGIVGLLILVAVMLVPATGWAQSGFAGVVRDTTGAVLVGFQKDGTLDFQNLSPLSCSLGSSPNSPVKARRRWYPPRHVTRQLLLARARLRPEAVRVAEASPPSWKSRANASTP